MRALSATELLDLWERAASQPPVQRALTLLAAACPETPPEALVELSIGRRDARLLALRELVFGSQFTAFARCPACDDPMELTFDARDLPAPPEAEPPAELAVEVEGHELRVRLPTSADLLALTRPDDLPAARAQLLARCLPGGRDHLPEHVLDAIVARMALADPAADVELALRCSHCGHAWRAAFDIASFFWREIHAWARGFLREVHTLAAAYGWREADILALSPARRHLYLEMVGE
jgi:hypothetical protein